MKYLPPSLVMDTILGLGSQFFTVVFRKSNGRIRKLNARRGVKKHLRGGRSSLRKCPWIMGVFDLKKKAYRAFSINKVLLIRANKKVIRP